MIKILVMLVRKPGLSRQEFRDIYESGHVVLAMELFGHLFLEYKRFYVGQTTAFKDGADGNNLAPAADAGCAFDAIAEIVLRDQNALNEMMEILGRPEVRRILAEDELRTFDRAACRMGVCDYIESAAHIQWP